MTLTITDPLAADGLLEWEDTRERLCREIENNLDYRTRQLTYIHVSTSLYAALEAAIHLDWYRLSKLERLDDPQFWQRAASWPHSLLHVLPCRECGAAVSVVEAVVAMASGGRVTCAGCRHTPDTDPDAEGGVA